MNALKRFLKKRKYLVLLIALILHLFIGVVLSDLAFYTRVVWPINMLLLGLTTFGVFVEKGKWKNRIRHVLVVVALILPISIPFLGHLPHFMQVLSWIYAFYFIFIFWEIVSFLVKPSYINIDIISASACGFFLLIEITVFVLQALFYSNPESIRGISRADPASSYMDLVYLSSIIQTTIGFGDITPNNHSTKLVVSLFGIIGQFYTVVLVGILISKFNSRKQTNARG